MSTVKERIEALERSRSLLPEHRVSLLEKALADRSPTVRGFAVELVCDNRVTQLLNLVVQALDDRNAEVRAIAVEGLSKHDIRASKLAKLLRDKDELVRVATAEALGYLADKSVLTALHTSLSDVSPLVRSFAAEAIGSIGEPRSIRRLETGLAHEEDDRARVGFVVGLAQLDGRDAVRELMRLFSSDNYRVRSSVVNSFPQLNARGRKRDQICSFLAAALEAEPTVAVRSSINAALESMCKVHSRKRRH